MLKLTGFSVITKKKVTAAFRDIPNHRPLIGNGAGPKIG